MIEETIINKEYGKSIPRDDDQNLSQLGKEYEPRCHIHPHPKITDTRISPS
jgi:hypothetical protein